MNLNLNLNNTRAPRYSTGTTNSVAKKQSFFYPVLGVPVHGVLECTRVPVLQYVNIIMPSGNNENAQKKSASVRGPLYARDVFIFIFLFLFFLF